jgi:periplasmic protein CpxP/Spy
MGEPERRARRVEELTRELTLTPEQAKQLDAILLLRHTQSRTIHDQADAQVEQVRQMGRNEIRAILSPEQRPKFEEFLRRTDEERKRNEAAQPR